MEVVLKPVTRIEGHARIYLKISDKKVEHVELNVIESPRFFEVFLTGKPAEEAPRIASRICGVCPVAHHLASVKAVEEAWEVEVGEEVENLRRLMLHGQHIFSHTLHMAFMCLPDLLDSQSPEKGLNLLLSTRRDLVEKAMEVYGYGSLLVEALGARFPHPVSSLPGGQSQTPTREKVRELMAKGEKALKTAKELADLILDLTGKAEEENKILSSVGEKSNFVSLSRNGEHDIYKGNIHVLEKDSSSFTFKPREYQGHIAELSTGHTYVKYPFLKKRGYPDGFYRVGPLARLATSRLDSVEAREHLEELKRRYGEAPRNPMAYNLARAIEVVASIEKSLELLEQLPGKTRRAEVKPRAGEGVGVVEAPRGLLVHHYATDERGVLKRVNLIVATCQNVPVMELEVKRAAEKLVEKVAEGDRWALNMLELVVRCYDPCLSCATHLENTPNVYVEVYSGGRLVKRIRR